jgi:drug/metabolite transporter (DMT)-like permease
MITREAAQIRWLLRSGTAEIGGNSQPGSHLQEKDAAGRLILGLTAVDLVGAVSARIAALLRSHGRNYSAKSAHSLPSASSPEPSATKLILAFAAIYLIWGSTYLAIRYAVETIPPLFMMGARHLIAGSTLYAWVRARGTPAPSRMHWKNASLAGLIFFLGSHGSLAWAEQKVPSGLAALLCATLPLWIVLLTWFSGRQRLRDGRLVGVVLGFIGVGVLVGPSGLRSGSAVDLLGTVVVLIGALLWAVGTLYTQSAELPSSASLSAAMQMITGGASLWLAGLITGEGGRLHVSTVTLKSAAALAYLIVFGSIVAFSAFTWLHKVSSATRNSTYAYVNPVVAVVLGWLLADEVIGIRTLIATAVILLSVFLVNASRTKSGQEAELDIGKQHSMEFRDRQFSSAD